MALARVVSLALPLAEPGLGRVTFAQLVDQHQGEVFGLALRMLGDRDAALDATSLVFLKAYGAFDRFDQSRPARPWLLRIAINECISIGRRLSRERQRQAPAEDALSVAGVEGRPEHEALQREDRERVRRAVAKLPELYRVPVVLRYFSGLSIEEIAGVTGRPSSTIGVQLLRARALLRGALEATQ